MDLSSRRTLGYSGLPVSPLTLGAMTFGNKTWGAEDADAQTLFNHFVDAGGNVIDTADVYSGGRSEELVGQFLAERSLRDKVVLATKFSFNGGNGRKNLHRALEGSLRRLATDYIDLYWVHVWDQVTPAEELLQSLTDLVRAGRIRYFALSDVPAWYATRMATLAQAHNTPGPIALQMEYSLAERAVEQEHIPAAQNLGLGFCPWSPLAFGFLSGKYTRDEAGHAKSGSTHRLDTNAPQFQKFTDRHWTILDTLREISRETGHSMARIALAWVVGRPVVTSTILGARTPAQLEDNLASLSLTLAPEHLAQLDQATAPSRQTLYGLFSPQIQRGIFAGVNVTPWR